MARNFPNKPFFSWMGWGMLRACPRRWFLYNFGRDLQGEAGWSALAERKLSYWAAFSGQLADDGITEAIRTFKRTRAWPEDMDDWLHIRATEYIKDSRNYTQAYREGRDLPYVERQVLMPYFFGEFGDNSSEERIACRKVLDEAKAAVARFFETELPGRLKVEPSEALMCDHKGGEFPWADQDGVPVYAVYDFAIKHDSDAVIFDWKTGKLTPDKENMALEQLHWYAQYAVKAWELPASAIRLAPVFLMATTEIHEFQVDENRLQRIRNEWQTAHTDIKSRMDRNKDAEGLIAEFPMTDDLRECKGCQFRSCPGYRRYLDAVNPESQ